MVERYDRVSGRRLHQEDFAQALGIRPGAKYITAKHLIDEASSWGLPERVARDVVAETADAVRSALGAVSAEPSDASVSGLIERRAVELTNT